VERDAFAPACPYERKPHLHVVWQWPVIPASYVFAGAGPTHGEFPRMLVHSIMVMN